MPRRNYGQFCGLARALELVGERWALLIVRDLLLGPKRFTDLRRGLPRIPTNILSVRLKELERDGVIHRRTLRNPVASAVYELTEYGRELDGVLLRLGVWGGRALTEPAPGDTTNADSIALVLRSFFRPAAASGVGLSCQLTVRGVVVSVRIDDGVLTVAEGPLRTADLHLETTLAINQLVLLSVEAIASGRVRCTGDPGLLRRFFEFFPVPVSANR